MVLVLRSLGPLSIGLLLGACFDPGGPGSNGTTTDSTGMTSTDDPAGCVPGLLQPCNCPDGTGNQECNAEGTAFGPCECVDGGSSGGSGGSGASGGSTETTAPEDTTQGGESSTSDPVDTGTSMGVGETSSGEETSSSGGFGPLSVGESCNDDAECMTGVCWNLHDYDPFCFGGACSLNCATDLQCINAMMLAGAPDPGGSSCGPDGRCATLGTGFGMYACAAEAEDRLEDRLAR